MIDYFFSFEAIHNTTTAPTTAVPSWPMVPPHVMFNKSNRKPPAKPPMTPRTRFHNRPPLLPMILLAMKPARIPMIFDLYGWVGGKDGLKGH